MVTLGLRIRLNSFTSSLQMVQYIDDNGLSDATEFGLSITSFKITIFTNSPFIAHTITLPTQQYTKPMGSFMKNDLRLNFED